MCLHLACKYEGEGSFVRQIDICKHLEYSCDVKTLQQMEMEILYNYLDFRVQRVTLVEVTNLVLFAADPSFDYSDILSRLIALQNFCMIDGEI